MTNYNNSNDNNNNFNENSTSISLTSTTVTTTTNNNNTNKINLSVYEKSQPNPNNNSKNHNSSSFNHLNTSTTSTDHCDMTSLEILNKCHLELFPKKEMICDDVKCKSFIEQLPILNGEYIQFIGPSGKSNDDILIITNYRLFQLIHNNTSFINIPLMLIEWIEMKEIVFLYVYLKNAKTLRITFGSNDKAALWYQRLYPLVSKIYNKLDELFAFTFYSWWTNEKLDDSNGNMKCFFSKNAQTNLMKQEFKRMKFDTKMWRLSDANEKFELCPTYPDTFIIPNCMTDEQMKKITTFRSSKRFPAVVWRSKVNGAVIARSSQPNVGLLGWRLNEDELLIKAIADCCCANNKAQTSTSSSNSYSASQANGNCLSSNNTNGSILIETTNGVGNTNNKTNGQANGIDQQNQAPSQMLLIIDARFRSVALANRVKGGGFEYSEYYTNCEIQFMNIENIHVIRSSFQSLRLLCQSINDNKTYLSQLENTKWLHHLSGIIKAACTVISAIDQYAKPVLVHCSDGWDRTPQILALSKLLLDPYYRTISGFRTLIEIDWIQFGHKFAQRNGHIVNYNDANERCPVFLQWLDCVYQISRQFPSAFQFNENYLLKLCHHSYSCLFGNFLCDSQIERVNEHTDERTFSIWSYLNDKNREMINHLYDDQFDEVIYPKFELVNMQLWQRLFCESEVKYLVKIDRNEIVNFNDSLDAGLYGSSPPLDQLHKQDDNSNEDLNNSKLTTSTSVSSSTSRINNLIKNAIDTNSFIVNSNQSISSIKSYSLSQSGKTRSYDDLSRLSKNKVVSVQKKNSLELKDVEVKSQMTNSLSNEGLNGLESANLPIRNEDSVQMRSSSESNLLLDALQNVTSTSPKFMNNIKNSIAFNDIKSESNSNQIQEENLLDTENPLKSKHEENEAKTNLFECDEQKNASLILSSLNNNNILTSSISNCNTTLINSNNSLFLMQNSTDTLVDENLLKSNLSQKSKREPLAVDTNLNASNNLENSNMNSNDRVSVASNSNGESSQSSTSTSTIPSPTLSTTNIKHLIINSKNDSEIALAQNKNRTLKTISTSTSGLSDYVESSKFRYLNDTIKCFEKNFNKNCDLVNGINSIGDEYLSSLNIYNGNQNDLFINEFNQFKLSSKENENPNNQNLNNNTENQKHDSFINNGKSQEGIRISSKSIPIAKKTSDKRIEMKKQNNKKSIHDCIDIDGLTKIEDASCRKLIERDENYKKEIAILKDQVNKCKWFFNKLVHNPVWQEYPSEYGNVELPEMNHSDENQNNSYSFSNDSVCSSWDEIDESDYKAASWVPDYYVTHCQSCNEKFSISLRKHHCRNCGQVFCYKCADQFHPLPNHNLTAPVRICHSCKAALDRDNSNKSQFNLKNQFFKQQPNNQISNFNSSTLIFSSTPPNFNSDFFSTNLKLNNNNNSNPTKLLLNPINLQQKSSNQQNSFSTSPLNHPLASTYPSTFNTQAKLNTNMNLSNTTSNTSNCNISLGSRCNQIESNKFKKNGNKTQKVSV